MQNAIRRKMARSELNQAIRTAFAGTKSIAYAEELTDGMYNTAYTLTLNDGKKVVLKVAPDSSIQSMRYEKGMMRCEVEVLRLLRARGDIPVPEVYYYSGDQTDLEYFIMEYMSGVTFVKVKKSLPQEEREVIEAELGRLNRLINDIEGERFGYYALQEQQGTEWPDVLRSMFGGILADARDAGVSLPMTEDEIWSVLDQAQASLEEVKTPCLVHWDLWDGNVFIRDGRITGLIDCERALWGDYLLEFNFRTVSGQSAAFLRGYGIEQLTPSEKTRSQIYDLYLVLILHIECAYRKYEDQRHIEWATKLLKTTWEGFTRSEDK
ncbi:phosphotransferase family protein [Paenibacillus sp. 79R4]|uniref:phosphotransferase family protein n=1 Tax=Paenibacillus sp. 79R4 TaxID=2212847 RepID=UPI0015B852DE|nr:aminoglycoside phosphotransferase family protein [Paenibacillus sp. 79R4]